MSNEPDKTQHRASFVVIDVASVSPTERRVRVLVQVSPSRWGYLSSVITLLVGEQGEEQEIRRAVCAKIYRETGLTYLPDELQTPALEPSVEANAEAIEEIQAIADEITADVVEVNATGKRKRRGKK